MIKKIFLWLIIGTIFLFLFAIGYAFYLFKVIEKGDVDLASDWIEIPFEYMSSGHIKIEVSIEGKKYPFLVDSGASNMLFEDPDELTNGFKGIGFGIDSNDQPFLTKIKSIDQITIGSLTANDLRFKIKEFSLGCEEVIGIIGKETMRNHVWQFLPKRKIIRIGKDQRSLLHYPQEDTLRLGVNSFGHQLSVYTAPEGRNKARYLIDTGFNGIIATSLDSTWNKTEGLQVIGVGSKGLNSVDSSENYLFKIPRFPLSKHLSIQGPLTVRASSKKFKAIGTGFLKNFNFSLDWKNKLMILHPLDSQDFMPHGFGARFDFDHRSNLYVSSVIENSPAHLNGLKLNQRINSLNDIPALELDDCSLDALIQQANTLVLVMDEEVTPDTLKIEANDYFIHSN